MGSDRNSQLYHAYYPDYLWERGRRMFMDYGSGHLIALLGLGNALLAPGSHINRMR